MNLIDITKCSGKAWWLQCCLCSSSKVLKRQEKRKRSGQTWAGSPAGWKCSCRCRGCHPQAILSKHSILNILDIQLILSTTQNIASTKQNIPFHSHSLGKSSVPELKLKNIWNLWNDFVRTAIANMSFLCANQSVRKAVVVIILWMPIGGSW